MPGSDFLHNDVRPPLKKKFVSCPAGGHNNGQSGGRKFLFFLISFFLHCIEMMLKMLEKKEKSRKCEINVHIRHL